MKLKRLFVCVITACAMLASAACSSVPASGSGASQTVNANPVNPEDVLKAYVAALANKDYEKMYTYISENSTMGKDDFLTRNKKIYEGIEARNIEISDIKAEDNTVKYVTSMDTQAGPVAFENTAYFSVEDGTSKLDWDSTLIFPNLNDDDKVRVKTVVGERGSLLDRNGKQLVGKGEVWSVFIVPGKLIPETREADIAALAEALGMTVEEINEKLAQKWVKDDLKVPLDKYISKTDLETEAKLLAVTGVGEETAYKRVYTLGEKAAALTGYIHNINADELKENEGKGYTTESKIGKVGLESLLEERLRGIDGCKVYIEDKDGKEKQVLAEIKAHNGEDVTLTIDADMQAKLYDQMKNDKGSAVVMDPNTGEILALVSTPSYDPNAFILGLSEEKWAEYNNEQTRPMYNRFKATYVPGSSFKPITAALGLGSGAFAADEDFGASGKAWGKDGWNGYTVTTLKTYSGGANVLNALVNSDNIYFAKAALKIGSDTFAQGLKSLGFGEQMPFEFGLGASTFGTEQKFDDELDLANSGYGQGKVELNPIHMAAIYSAFVTGGNMMLPYLEKGKSPQVWKQGVFTPEAVQTVKNAMVQVIDSPSGTGHEFKIDGLTMAGKTGTAEIKNNKDDTQGTELGWFVTYPADGNQSKQFLTVMMIEDVKGRHGSHYVIPLVRALYE